MKAAASWIAFPYASSAFDHPPAELKKRWGRLHAGDKEPFPSPQYLAKLCKREPRIADAIPAFDGDFDGLSARLLQAWRSYHRGEFERARRLGLELGPVGHSVAHKATAIYANYLEKNEATKIEVFDEVVQRAEGDRALLGDHPNCHYLYAYALGRRSQSTSVLEALVQGLAGNVKRALERTIELEPEHAEAHTALGTYHAEVLAKVGSMLGGLTYGASQEQAIEHYERGLALNPASAIARIEFANGLLLIDGKSHLDQATQLYVEASLLAPADAMEQLDVALAKSRLEED
jgi:tetratricopeptide (TPR) repeat protein